MTEERYGDLLFSGIENIRHSRFSYYIVQNEDILEINSMTAIYFGLKEISDNLDRLNWGILYPIYRDYCSTKKIKKFIRRTK